MTQTSDTNYENPEALIAEIEKACLEMYLSERAFQWAQNDSEAVDLAIIRKQAAVEHFDFLIKQAKKTGLKLDKNQLINKILK
ncbi:MAG: DUF2508 family protein [Tepidanaerobacter acetatoxydans]|uniref:DUF2508 family protein n=1 Tax=Tepidanaerobacter TaxID=499228 RepID=UPI000A920A79|nr:MULTISPECIES: DUF2508 family protein [Tepidanaerobacter]NLU09972.1 DUF2508 family protein [Tepidanaerobacter acetatoxydans]